MAKAKSSDPLAGAFPDAPAEPVLGGLGGASATPVEPVPAFVAAAREAARAGELLAGAVAELLPAPVAGPKWVCHTDRQPVMTVEAETADGAKAAYGGLLGVLSFGNPVTTTRVEG